MSRNPLVNNNNRTREHHRSTSLGKRTAQATSSSSSTTGTIAPTIPALTPAQMYSNFEEWLKACTDNVSLFSAFSKSISILTLSGFEPYRK
jgi:hypothetical protein